MRKEEYIFKEIKDIDPDSGEEVKFMAKVDKNTGEVVEQTKIQQVEPGVPKDMENEKMTMYAKTMRDGKIREGMVPKRSTGNR